MAEGRETHVSYSALAKFPQLFNELRKVRREIAKTRAAEEAFNASSAKERSAATKASTARAKALASENANLKGVLANLVKYRERQKSVTTSVIAANKVINAQNRALKTNTANLIAATEAAKAYATAQRNISKATGLSSDAIRAQREFSKAQRESSDAVRNDTRELRENARARQEASKANVRFVEGVGDVNEATGEVVETLDRSERRLGRWARAVERAREALSRFRRDGDDLPPVFRNIEYSGDRLYRSLQRFSNWRPRLIPPFVALIPIIGAVIAAINPLMALMGSLGSVALGLAGSIGSLSGAFLALPGILSGVVAGISSVIASMGGVGNVFKTYSAMQKAVNSARGGAGSGPTQAERAEALADAEWNLAKAQRNVQKAQENLNKARQQALKDLIDLRIEVSRASLNEERAIANLRKAQEDYWNVMADPGSTLGDKLDAAAAIKEAEADLQDVRKKNTENQKALNEAEKRGINNSEQVLDAQERLTDALKSQRDAQKALVKEQNGGSAGASAAVAIQEYNKALNELSPSARKFVLAIIAMQNQWKAFRREMQEAFFSQFVSELDRLPSLLNNLRSFLLPAARAMGQFTKAFMIMMDSPEWTTDLKTIGEQNGSVISDLGDAFLDLATAFKDIIIAAGPFTKWMTSGFAKGSKNFRDFIGDARETGRLAAWLDKVADRMSKWWQVVKNVGATIFNYSAAAEDFGGWLLDGFVNLSEGWRKSSEEARKEGSPFREYLEEIKPLLQEVKGLFGDFFGWLREEMMDPENIQDAQDLVRLIREDLGPALSRLLDALAKTDIDEKFVEALASIIDSLATLMENGGGEALETFFVIVEEFFEFLADVTENIDPKILEAILKFVGGLAAVAFIGKFTGLTNLLGAILGFGGKTSIFKNLSNMVKDFGKLDKLKFASLLGKTGLVAAIASLLVISWNTAQKTAPFEGSMWEALKNPTPENAKETVDKGVEDGNALKWITGPTSPFKFLMPGLAGVGLGGISEILSFIDDLTGSNASEEFDNFLEDISRGFVEWWAGIEEWWTTTVTPGWDAFWGALGDPETWFSIGEGFGTFLQGIQTEWGNFVEDFETGKLWENIKTELKNFGADFRTNWNNYWSALGTHWDTFWKDLKSGKLWENIQKELGTLGKTFKVAWDVYWSIVKNNFKTVVNGLGDIWRGIQNLLATPVNWVITNVWNRGIVQFWNGLASKLGWNKLTTFAGIPEAKAPAAKGRPVNRGQYKDGGVLPGYTPGRDVHDFVSPTGGRLQLSGGEAIMRPEFTRLVGGKKGVDELNKKARRGQAFANGGVFNGGSGIQKFAGGGVWEVAGDLWDRFKGLFSNPVKYVTEGFMNAVGPLSGLPNSEYGNMLRKLPSTIASNLAGTAQDKVKTAKRAEGVTADANGMKWQSMWAVVKKAFPWARLNSAYYDRIGGKTYHAKGRAIDTNPSMAIFNWLRENFPNSRELIYSPAGGRQLRNGANYYWGEPVRSAHFNHVHWAMKNGGVIPGLYDNGGWLPDGGLAVNRSGKPEAVLDPMESRALKALLSGSGLSARPASFGATAATAVNATPKIVDNSINIDQVTIQNPVPEKVSESLPRAIRRIGYMNEARVR